MYQKQYDFAARLIERGANLTAFDRNGNQLLHAAVLANQPALVRALLGKGADANASTGTSKVKMRFEGQLPRPATMRAAPEALMLLLAAESGYAEVMQILLAGGANPQVRIPDGTNRAARSRCQQQAGCSAAGSATGARSQHDDKRTATHRSTSFSQWERS